MNRSILILSLTALFFLVACGSQATPTEPSPTATNADRPSNNTPASNTPVPAPSPTTPPNTTTATTALTTPPPTQMLDVTLETPTETVTQSSQIPVFTEFIDAPDRNLYELAAQLSPDVSGPISPVVNPQPVSYSEGRLDTFWLLDAIDLEVTQEQFELRLVTPHAYWYIQEGLLVTEADLLRSAEAYEEVIYPKVTEAFGVEWVPGVDNDPHLTIINARLRGVGGYYSSADEYPSAVAPFSNQREAIYINTGFIPIGTLNYEATLAHELQHAIHWNADSSEDSWVNEGLSELAASFAGYGSNSQRQFLNSGPVSLTNWPLSPVGSSASYGGASLFMHYLSQHYGSSTQVIELVNEARDGIQGVNAYLEALGFDASFETVFGDWVVANFLDEDRGPYGYKDLVVSAQVDRTLSGFTEFRSSIPQQSVEYVRLSNLEGPVRLRFTAPTESVLLPTEVGDNGCWWSNSGDSISSTLTREINLEELDNPVLSYATWFQVEESWDYVYLQVSMDNGLTWDILQAPGASPENPIGNGFGPGYTGNSGGWLDESVDLSDYAGRKILLRFQYVTDDAVNAAGFCFRGIFLSGGEISDTDGEWQADGFIFTDNRVPQEFLVQLIGQAEANRVERMELDQSNSGELIIENPADFDRLIVAVAALAPKTQEFAGFTLTVEPAL